MERGLVCMSSMQELLDKEAMLSNSGQDDSLERQQILTIIRLKRQAPPPVCFGEDDCSIARLTHCPWRMDCGAEGFWNVGG
mgnify:CR=1 FL=1